MISRRTKSCGINFSLVADTSSKRKEESDALGPNEGAIVLKKNKKQMS